ncbi:energy transducer TonB [Hymenobacter daeguensis]
MKRFLLFCICIVSSVSTCLAQISCDFLYAKEDSTWKAWNDEGRVGLIVFDVPPRVVFGKEKLTNYSDTRDKAGAVMYRVRIDSLGNPSCLRVVHADNTLLVAEANRIMETLKFSPAQQHGRSIDATMHVTVRFYSGKPPKQRHS